MRVGILGAGHIAGSMTKALKGLEQQGKDVYAYAIASRNIEKAKEFANANDIDVAYGSYEELLEDSQVDLVYIATPHSHHYEQIKLCLEYGKAVLCEKAFTVNAKQAREVMELASEKGLLLAEAIWTRYMPSMQRVQKMIEKGIIGKVQMITASFSQNVIHLERLCNPELAGGALLDLGVYPLHFACATKQEQIKEVKSSCVKYKTGVDAKDSITLIFEDDTMAVLECSMMNRSDWRGHIGGDLGYIEVERLNNPKAVRVYNTIGELVQELQLPEQINGYEYEVLACKEALERGLTQCPQMPLSETLRIMELTDIIRKQWGLTYPCE